MDQEEQLITDWYVRYNSIMRKRYTKRQKDRFLQSLAADIKPFRSDVKVDTFKLHEKDSVEYKNLYVGDIKKADTIICTYYDTPVAHLGPYHFFDVEHRKKNSVKIILLSSISYILFGLLFTWLIGIPVFETYSFLSLPYLFCILFYGLYFLFLGRVTKGWPRKDNLMRNTSSLLAQLLGIQQNQNNRTAFAFVDAGCTNEAGLEKLINSSKGNVYHFDSIGTDKPLYQVMSNRKLAVAGDEVESVEVPEIDNNRLVRVISGEKENNRFWLNQGDLKQSRLNDTNMNKATALMKRVVGRKR